MKARDIIPFTLPSPSDPEAKKKLEQQFRQLDMIEPPPGLDHPVIRTATSPEEGHPVRLNVEMLNYGSKRGGEFYLETVAFDFLPDGSVTKEVLGKPAVTVATTWRAGLVIALLFAHATLREVASIASTQANGVGDLALVLVDREEAT